MVLRVLLDAVLTPEVDAMLTGFFASEYLVYWISVTVTPPDPERQTVSFRWHCDKGPAAHLKLLVYLNGTPEHGGNTEFIDLADTEGVARLECHDVAAGADVAAGEALPGTVCGTVSLVR